MAYVIICGTFDMLYICHQRQLQRTRVVAGENGTQLVVLSSDQVNWVEKHEKYATSGV